MDSIGKWIPNYHLRSVFHVLVVAPTYIWPFGPSTMGRPRHGTEKHGPGTTRLGSLRARAWHGPVVVPCLGRHVGPQCRPRHGTNNGPARHGPFILHC